MPRPQLTSRLSSLPGRKKNGSVEGGEGSRSSSPSKPGLENKTALILKVTVLKGKDLAAKDKSGTSDPYLVLTLGDAREATSTINKTLNPEWNQTIELPITGISSMILEAVCWDKDRFGKDYMGEFDTTLEDVFANGHTSQEPKWYPLASRKSGKKKSNVTGEVLLKFEVYDPNNASATPEQILHSLMSIAATDSIDEDEDELLARAESADADDDGSDDEDDSDESDDSISVVDKQGKKKKMRLARLKKKAKQHGYEFNGMANVAGVLFLEVQKITDLPPERNLTRTSFDMDPFVVTSLGRKTYRTKVIRHNLNPVYDEKLVFQVMKHEIKYSLSFSVVDRDKLSGNDFVGTTNFPLEEVTRFAPEADPETGLYKLPDIPDHSSNSSGSPPDAAKRSRFRLPMSRSSSATSLAARASNSGSIKPKLKKESSSGSLTAVHSNEPAPSPPISKTPPSQSLTASELTPPVVVSAPKESATTTADVKEEDEEGLRSFILPLEMKNKDRWETKHNPLIYIRARYLPYKALRQQFWRAMLKQYDADESGQIDKIELSTMLDSLGSTLHDSTIDGFFKRFQTPDNNGEFLTFDQATLCLEDQLQRTQAQTWGNKVKSYMPNITTADSDSITTGDNGSSTVPSGADSGAATPLNNKSELSVIPAIKQEHLGEEGAEGGVLDKSDDLADERGEEHVIEIRECPICHQPRLNKKSDADIITHVATCASQDWRQVNNVIMAGFVTSSQAQRKWYSKVITKIGYGGYKLGANSANILVQDRITGQINEERMSVYVRLGIRLLYKGLKSSNMEKKRARKLLKSLSIKQGKKYDDPASVNEIQGFINFHQLNMGEVLLKTEEFKSFNEFFFRALKPGARPCSAPDRPEIITSPADCRSVVFNRLDEAQSIWVKGREFNVERLLGKAYPEDAKRYAGGAMGIFRLAPQDYHRFHIPVDGVIGEPKLIEGEYYTVNPMAIRSALDVYGENIRYIVPIDSVAHGRVMVICVGAMMVGSTVITRKTGEKVKRAEELGYFKFGGSTLLVLFEAGVVQFDEDLVDNSRSALETLISVGMSIGRSIGHEPHTPDMRKDNPTMAEKQDAKRRIEGSLAPSGSGSGGPVVAG
ncbi:hypothetical protein K402DRAFT_418046 [Aulographum hederae CBS 113979]|uniref:Phosphatidylserine decarboxylase proenzyme 2 n=1 Tax=Aulographum hederae CBS 113979 TaxID=1176131 RepID=A0A6G1HAG0_9PEZI|nr:hypothetical protein K402DRAFT_418046 [Aulographum hederae CBS 113979]